MEETSWQPVGNRRLAVNDKLSTLAHFQERVIRVSIPCDGLHELIAE
jgi:hypothetical protein